MTLESVLARIEHARGDLTVYAAADVSDVLAQFDTRNVSVDHRPLPDGSNQEFVVFRRRGEFVTSIGLDEFREFLEPPILRPWDDSFVSAEYRAVLEALDNTLCRSFERRQLLATAREIENRAWRIGQGTLHVAFQRLSAFRSQLSVYEHLGEHTDLEIHIYARPDWKPPDVPNTTIHADRSAEIGQFWVLAFDGGGDELGACAMLARERDSDPGTFDGFWTYDADLVREISRHLEDTYHSAP